MKRNSEYVGVDEKFIPEEERYVNDSILGSREEAKKKIKKGLKIGLGAYAIWSLVVIAIFVVAVVLIFNFSKKMNNQIIDMYDKATDEINDMYNSATDQMNDETQNQEDTANKMEEIEDAMSNMMNQFINDNSNK